MRTLVATSILAISIAACSRSRGAVVADEPHVATSASAPATDASVVASTAPSTSATFAPSIAVSASPPVPPRIVFARVERSGSYDEHLAYPTFTFADAALTRDVNGVVAARIRRLRDDFASDLRQTVKDLADDGHDAAIDPRPFLAVSCDVGWASNDLLSIGCDSYAFLGGAHGSKSYGAIDLELPSMREVKLRSLIRSTSSARDELRDLCDAKIAADMTAVDPGSDPPTLDDSTQLLDFGTFVLRPTGVFFDFKNQFPFVSADVMHCEISYADLAPLLVPAGPASRVRAGVPHASAKAPTSVWDARAKEEG